MFIAARTIGALSPILVGLGQLATAPAGPQLFARRAQRCAEAGLCIARLDIRNAYNSLERCRVIEVLDHMISEARQWHHDAGSLMALRAAYGSSEEVFWRRRSGPPVIFTNERGITQGCPAGVLTFGAVMADILDRTRRDLKGGGIEAAPLPPKGQPLPADSAVGYTALHDDVVFAAADQELLLVAVQTFKANLAAAGMELGIGDGKSILLIDDAADLTPDILEAFAGQRASVAKCAGIPVHAPTPAARTRANSMLASTVRERLQPLRALRHAHPQDAVNVITAAGARSRTQYFAALTPEAAPWPALRQEADDLTRLMLGHALGKEAVATTELQYLVALLPASAGGLGIRSCLLEGRLDRHASRILDARDAGSADELEDAQAAYERASVDLHRQLVSLAWRAVREDDHDIVQLSHQKQVAALWTTNVSHNDRTLMTPRVASKVLAMHLLTAPVSQVVPCGEPRQFRAGGFTGSTPSVGPTGVHRGHVYTCKHLTTSRHSAVCLAARRRPLPRPPGCPPRAGL